MILRKTVLATALVLSTSAVALACIWDRDTLEMETKAFPEIADVITGKFPRNPPLYYTLRLDRVTAHLEANPDDLAAYDDAGVACDRLGFGDEAIAWMQKKRTRIDALAAATEGPGDDELATHRYRYAANLGTFHAHRWLRDGAAREDLIDLQEARRLIAHAIQLNPDAHFGRERYQLRAIEWLLVATPWKPKARGTSPLGDFLGIQGDSNATYNHRDNEYLKTKGIPDALRGLAGLIVLGNAWESVDIFHALSLAAQADGKSSVAQFARLRAEELVRGGRGSLRPGAPQGDLLLKAMFEPALLEKDDLAKVKRQYAERRQAAREWIVERHGEMLRRLREGRHPDTDPTFYDGIE